MVIPTNRPVRRIDKHDLIYKTRREKYNAIMDEIERQHQRGLPVLVGTVSVDVSETLSRMIKRRGLKHEVLNAKQHQREAEIVAQAGQPGSITIATNMAGRGTDIQLGPGRDRTGGEEGEVITHPWVTGAIGQAQKRVELQHFQARKKLLEYDDVMNQQREVIYSLRQFALEGGEELKAEALHMVEAAVERLADGLVAEFDDPAQWDRALFETEFLQKFLISVPGVTDPTVIHNRDDLVRAAQQAVREAFQAKLGAQAGSVRLGERALSRFMLGVIDEKWKDHLYDLDQLREGIYYRSWGQKDPLVEYKTEAFDMFKGLMSDVENTFAEGWFKD